MNKTQKLRNDIMDLQRRIQREQKTYNLVYLILTQELDELIIKYNQALQIENRKENNNNANN